jgi:hypothetical protein
VSAAPTKPLYGSPCNGCGLCCIEVQCPLSEAIFGLLPYCPALEDKPEGGFGCGLASSPERYIQVAPKLQPIVREAFFLLIGAGAGCDATTTEADRLAEAEVKPIIFRRAMAAVDAASPEARRLLSFIRGFGRIPRSV